MFFSNLQIDARTDSGLAREELTLLSAIAKMAIERNVGSRKGTFAFFCQQDDMAEQCILIFELPKGESLAYWYRPKRGSRIKVMSHEAVLEDALDIFYAKGYPRESEELHNSILRGFPANILTMDVNGGSLEMALYITNEDQEVGNTDLILLAFARALFYLRDDAKLRAAYEEVEKKMRWQYRHSSPDSISIDDIERMVDVVDRTFYDQSIPEVIAWREWREGSGKEIANKPFFA